MEHIRWQDCNLLDSLSIDPRTDFGDLNRMIILPAEIIKKKRNALSLNEEEIGHMISQYSANKLPDYQMAAFLMAVYFQGMSTEETLALTKAMIKSGEEVYFDKNNYFCVDKHSTGGVGDKTSLILAPIVAAAGVHVPMISGRGLGHTGGTLDKLESIPGFNTQIELSQFKQMVERHGLCFIGQTNKICPADKKIYALRDVTATIESYPLICASIMSKKIAEGIHGLVLDIKCGSGAFMKTRPQASELAHKLMDIAKGYGLKVVSLITNMDQPLGRFAGNALEVQECLDIMSGQTKIAEGGVDFYSDTRELSLQLSAHMLFQSGKGSTLDDSYKLARDILDSGKALKKFFEVCESQNGDIAKLPRAQNKIELCSVSDGFIGAMNTELIGLAAVKIGAGRAKTTDLIEPTAGIEFHVKVGMPVKKGQLLFTVYGADKNNLQQIRPELLESISVVENAIAAKSLILETLY